MSSSKNSSFDISTTSYANTISCLSAINFIDIANKPAKKDKLDLPPLAPPILRRQTHSSCENCGKTREEYGKGYKCWNCDYIQQNHC